MNMFDKFKTKQCPQCGAYWPTYTARCPKCGDLFNERKESSVGLFSSNNMPAADARNYAPRRFDSSSYEIFSSRSRTAENEGYTQQHAVAHEKKYYGVSADTMISPDDTEYFRSDRKKEAVYTPVRGVVKPSDDEFYSSYKNVHPKEASTADIPHDAESNPYSDAPELTEAPQKTEHSEEYKANNIREYTKHHFVKKIVDKIELLLSAILVTAFLCVVFEQAFIAPYLSVILWYISVGYAVLIYLFAAIAIKTWNKVFSYIMSYLTIAYSLFMTAYIYIFGIRKTVGVFDFCIMFIPIAAVCILSLRLTKQMSQFRESWEAYCDRNNGIDTSLIDHDYEIWGDMKDSVSGHVF